MTEGLARLASGAALWRWDTGGDGAAVVLAHPHSGNHRSWDLQRDALAAAGYRVIGYSRRGYYQSEAGPENALGAQADDLAALLDERGVERAHIVGSAAGGSTALDFALAFPDRTLSAVVASSIMSIDEPDYLERSARARGPWFDALPIEARELSASLRAFDPDAVDAWLEIHRLNPTPYVRQPLKSRIDWDSLGRNARPLLLLTGGADLYLPPALLRWAAPRIGGASFQVVPDVGHPIFLEAPEAFNRLVLDFVGGASGV